MHPIQMNAVAVFDSKDVKGHTTFTDSPKGVIVRARFLILPPGEHGFHIHSHGDLRAPGCAGACAHFHKGPAADHGGAPGSHPRHTGDLGNIRSNIDYKWKIPNLRVSELYGRSLIVHADPDDLGKGEWPDSKTTGHSGARIACAIIGRVSTRKTRRVHRR